MSFLLDPPLLVAAGILIERSNSPKPIKAAMEVGTLATFIGTSVSLYLNDPKTKWLWEICGANSGRDWMLNSGVFHFDYEDDENIKTHMISGAIFATYPIWLRLGRKVGRRIFKACR